MERVGCGRNQKRFRGTEVVGKGMNILLNKEEYKTFLTNTIFIL